MDSLYWLYLQVKYVFIYNELVALHTFVVHLTHDQTSPHTQVKILPTISSPTIIVQFGLGRDKNIDKLTPYIHLSCCKLSLACCSFDIFSTYYKRVGLYICVIFYANWILFDFLSYSHSSILKTKLKWMLIIIMYMTIMQSIIVTFDTTHIIHYFAALEENFDIWL